jgi:hypothetical protein
LIEKAAYRSGFDKRRLSTRAYRAAPASGIALAKPGMMPKKAGI